jgi:hypothetical protein
MFKKGNPQKCTCDCKCVFGDFCMKRGRKNVKKHKKKWLIAAKILFLSIGIGAAVTFLCRDEKIDDSLPPQFSEPVFYVMGYENIHI